MITKPLREFPDHPELKGFFGAMQTYARQLEDTKFVEICKQNIVRFEQDYAWFEKHLGMTRLSKEAQAKIDRFNKAKLQSTDLLDVISWLRNMVQDLTGRMP